MLQNPKHEAFCRLIAEGGKGPSEAYKEVYNPAKPTMAALANNAQRLLNREDVEARIAELKQIGAEKAGFTLAEHLATLADLRDAAARAAQFSAAISAEVARGKAAGVAVDKMADAVRDSAKMPTVILMSAATSEDATADDDDG